jgi:hypothetical protein
MSTSTSTSTSTAASSLVVYTGVEHGSTLNAVYKPGPLDDDDDDDEQGFSSIACPLWVCLFILITIGIGIGMSLGWPVERAYFRHPKEDLLYDNGNHNGFVNGDELDDNICANDGLCMAIMGALAPSLTGPMTSSQEGSYQRDEAREWLRSNKDILHFVLYARTRPPTIRTGCLLLRNQRRRLAGKSSLVVRFARVRLVQQHRKVPIAVQP